MTDKRPTTTWCRLDRRLLQNPKVRQAGAAAVPLFVGLLGLNAARGRHGKLHPEDVAELREDLQVLGQGNGHVDASLVALRDAGLVKLHTDGSVRLNGWKPEEWASGPADARELVGSRPRCSRCKRPAVSGGRLCRFHLAKGAAWRQAAREQRQAEDLCSRCTSPAVPGRRLCYGCAERERERQRQLRAKRRQQ